MNAQAAKTEKAITAKETFETNLAAPYQHSDAVLIAKRLVESLHKATVSTNVSNIKAELQQLLSAPNTDIAKVLELSEKLKTNDADEQKKRTKAAELTKTFTLSEVLTAFSVQYEELVYQVGSELLERATVALNAGGKGKTGATSTSTTVANAEGATTIVYSRRGKGAANLMQDKETFEFLGFTVSKDAEGEHLEPATLVQTDGNEIPANRGNILKAIASGNVKSLAGFKIVADENNEAE